MSFQVVLHHPEQPGNTGAIGRTCICAGAGLVPCLLFYVVTELPRARLFTENHPAIMIPVLAVMACCIALACIAGIRSRLAAVTRQSIVDNIREL